MARLIGFSSLDPEIGRREPASGRPDNAQCNSSEEIFHQILSAGLRSISGGHLRQVGFRTSSLLESAEACLGQRIGGHLV